MFKKRKGINLPYNKQGIIYFTCMDIKNQPPEIQRKVAYMCEEIGAEDSEALYEFLTNEYLNVNGVAQKYFISETKLYELRKKFYEAW